MDGRMLDGCVDGWMCAQMDECMGGWMDRWMTQEGQVDGWIMDKLKGILRSCEKE